MTTRIADFAYILHTSRVCWGAQHVSGLRFVQPRGETPSVLEGVSAAPAPLAGIGKRYSEPLAVLTLCSYSGATAQLVEGLGPCLADSRSGQSGLAQCFISRVRSSKTFALSVLPIQTRYSLCGRRQEGGRSEPGQRRVAASP